MSTPKRDVLIAGNWKMNHGPQETIAFARALQNKWKPHKAKALVFVPAVSLSTALAEFKQKRMAISVGAQNVHFEEKGAFTGEISGPMLKELGIEWTLVGHSERRQYFGETDETVKKRSESHLKQGFKVVLCIGETRAEREAGKTETVIETQMKNGLPNEWSDRLIIAYEPVWAIGTGLTATPEQAQEAHAFTRKQLAVKYGEAAAQKTLILYGGSVTPENIKGLLAKPDVDGGLVGGASLKPESFLALLEGADFSIG